MFTKQIKPLRTPKWPHALTVKTGSSSFSLPCVIIQGQPQFRLYHGDSHGEDPEFIVVTFTLKDNGTCPQYCLRLYVILHGVVSAFLQIYCIWSLTASIQWRNDELDATWPKQWKLGKFDRQFKKRGKDYRCFGFPANCGRSSTWHCRSVTRHHRDREHKCGLCLNKPQG